MPMMRMLCWWTNLNNGMFFFLCFLGGWIESPVVFSAPSIQPLSIPHAFNLPGFCMVQWRERRLMELTPCKSHPHPKIEQSPNHPVILEGGIAQSDGNFRHRLEKNMRDLKIPWEIWKKHGAWKRQVYVLIRIVFIVDYLGASIREFSGLHSMALFSILCNFLGFDCNQNADRKHPRGVM